MSSYRVLEGAGHRIDEIYLYARDKWGEDQAQDYIRGLFAYFDSIAARGVSWRPIPAELGIDGHFSRYKKHFAYWKILGDGAVGMVTVLHERMHQIERMREDLDP